MDKGSMIFAIASVVALVIIVCGFHIIMTWIAAWTEVTITLNSKRDTSTDALVSKVANTTEVLMRDKSKLSTFQRIRLCVEYHGMLRHALRANRLLRRYNKKLTYTEEDVIARGKTLFTGGVDLPED